MFRIETVFSITALTGDRTMGIPVCHTTFSRFIPNGQVEQRSRFHHGVPKNVHSQNDTKLSGIRKQLRSKWRKRVGVEPTDDRSACHPPVLKTGTITGPHALPFIRLAAN